MKRDGDLRKYAGLKNQPGDFILAHGGARVRPISLPPVSSTNISWSRFIPVALEGGARYSLFSGLRMDPVDLRCQCARVSAQACGSRPKAA